MKERVNLFNQGKIFKEKFKEICQGWSAYSDWSNNYLLKEKILKNKNKKIK